MPSIRNPATENSISSMRNSLFAPTPLRAELQSRLFTLDLCSVTVLAVLSTLTLIHNCGSSATACQKMGSGSLSTWSPCFFPSGWQPQYSREEFGLLVVSLGSYSLLLYAATFWRSWYITSARTGFVLIARLLPRIYIAATAVCSSAATGSPCACGLPSIARTLCAASPISGLLLLVPSWVQLLLAMTECVLWFVTASWGGSRPPHTAVFAALLHACVQVMLPVLAARVLEAKLQRVEFALSHSQTKAKTLECGSFGEELNEAAARVPSSTKSKTQPETPMQDKEGRSVKDQHAHAPDPWPNVGSKPGSMPGPPEPALVAPAARQRHHSTGKARELMQSLPQRPTDASKPSAAVPSSLCTEAWLIDNLRYIAVNQKQQEAPAYLYDSLHRFALSDNPAADAEQLDPVYNGSASLHSVSVKVHGLKELQTLVAQRLTSNAVDRIMDLLADSASTRTGGAACFRGCVQLLVWVRQLPGSQDVMPSSPRDSSEHCGKLASVAMDALRDVAVTKVAVHHKSQLWQQDCGGMGQSVVELDALRTDQTQNAAASVMALPSLQVDLVWPAALPAGQACGMQLLLSGLPESGRSAFSPPKIVVLNAQRAVLCELTATWCTGQAAAGGRGMGCISAELPALAAGLVQLMVLIPATESGACAHALVTVLCMEPAIGEEVQQLLSTAAQQVVARDSNSTVLPDWVLTTTSDGGDGLHVPRIAPAEEGGQHVLSLPPVRALCTAWKKNLQPLLQDIAMLLEGRHQLVDDLEHMEVVAEGAPPGLPKIATKILFFLARQSCRKLFMFLMEEMLHATDERQSSVTISDDLMETPHSADHASQQQGQTDQIAADPSASRDAADSQKWRELAQQRIAGSCLHSSIDLQATVVQASSGTQGAGQLADGAVCSAAAEQQAGSLKSASPGKAKQLGGSSSWESDAPANRMGAGAYMEASVNSASQWMDGALTAFFLVVILLWLQHNAHNSNLLPLLPALARLAACAFPLAWMGMPFSRHGQSWRQHAHTLADIVTIVTVATMASTKSCSALPAPFSHSLLGVFVNFLHPSHNLVPVRHVWASRAAYIGALLWLRVSCAMPLWPSIDSALLGVALNVVITVCVEIVRPSLMPARPTKRGSSSVFSGAAPVHKKQE